MVPQARIARALPQHIPGCTNFILLRDKFRIALVMLPYTTLESGHEVPIAVN